MPRQYYKKTPKRNLIYFYSIVFPKVSDRPLIRPVRTPIYYDVKKFFEEELADKNKLTHLGIKPGMVCKVKRIEGKEMNTSSYSDPAVIARLKSLESDFDALDRQLPDTPEGLERFFEQEEKIRDKKINSVLATRPMMKMTESDFFKLMLEENYKGLAETFHKDWNRISKAKRDLGLKEDEL